MYSLFCTEYIVENCVLAFRGQSATEEARSAKGPDVASRPATLLPHPLETCTEYYVGRRRGQTRNKTVDVESRRPRC